MGRPSSCDCRCGEEEVQPAITDCENLLCVAFIDENSSGIGSLEAKMLKFIEAFPNRVMVILDVAWSELTYTSAFINHPRAFSLSLEYDISTTGLIRKMVRDNGQESIAITNDPWERIKTILDRYGLTTWLNTSNTEVSIFIDNSGSMRATNVASTVNKLEADLEADGKSRTESIINTSEDIICPFVVPECCEAGAVAEELATLCGYTWNCPPELNATAMAHWGMEQPANSDQLDSVGSMDLTQPHYLSTLSKSSDSKFGTSSITAFASNSWLEVAEDQDLFIAGQSWSIAVWFKGYIPNIGLPYGTQIVLSKGFASSSPSLVFEPFFDLTLGPTYPNAGDIGDVTFSIYDAASNSSLLRFRHPAIGPANWNLIVVTLDLETSKQKVSVNGDTYVEGALTVSPNSSTAPFVVGKEETPFATVGPAFQGLIDNVTVFDDKLPQDQVDLLWNGGVGLDYPFTY